MARYYSRKWSNVFSSMILQNHFSSWLAGWLFGWIDRWIDGTDENLLYHHHNHYNCCHGDFSATHETMYPYTETWESAPKASAVVADSSSATAVLDKCISTITIVISVSGKSSSNYFSSFERSVTKLLENMNHTVNGYDATAKRKKEHLCF